MKRKKVIQEPNKTILVVTSNESNQLYFSQMRKDCRYSNLTVACLDHAKDLSDFIVKSARMRNKGGYSVVWALFDFVDFDVKVDQVKEAMPLAEQKKVNLAWNNPSQDLWYLLHFQSPRGVVTDAKVFVSALQNLIPGYARGPEYMMTDGLAFHLGLYPNKSKAANNAEPYNHMAEAQTGLPATNMVSLLNDITKVCGQADITHNQRQLGKK